VSLALVFEDEYLALAVNQTAPHYMHACMHACMQVTEGSVLVVETTVSYS
jgi:hypothetical protein